MRTLYLDFANLACHKAHYDIQYETSIFPGGEVFLRLKTNNFDDKTKVIITLRPTQSSDIMLLCNAVDALRRMGVEHIEVVLTYLPYARQDRKCNEGEAFSLKVFANILNSLNLKKVTAYDVHSSMAEALIDNFHNISNASLIYSTLVVEKIDDHETVNLVVPDAGAEKKIYGVLSSSAYPFGNFNINLVVCSKTRDLKTTAITKTVVPEIGNNEPCIIVDDLCDGGRTFTAIADELERQSMKHRKVLCVTHGIFSKGFSELCEHFDHIYTTDSFHKELNPGPVYGSRVTAFPISSLGE